MNATCEAILMRQFDADCEAGKPLPDDVAKHLSVCSSCQSAWAEGSQMDHYLQSHMKEEPGNHLYRRSYMVAVNEHTTEHLNWFWWRQSAIALLIGLAVGGATHIFAELNGLNWLNVSVFLFSASVVFLLSIMWHLRDTEN